MSLDELIRKDLIRKDSPDIKKAENSLKLAEHNIEIAKKSAEAESYESAFISAYAAMFHCARAVLFRDGYKERSHYALYVYLRERYRDKIEMRYIHELNSLRTIRHKVIYGDEDLNIREVQESEVESAIKAAEGFLKAVRKLIES